VGERGSVPREQRDAFFANFIDLSVSLKTLLPGTWTYTSPCRAKAIIRPFENISDTTGKLRVEIVFANILLALVLTNEAGTITIDMSPTIQQITCHLMGVQDEDPLTRDREGY